MRVTVRGQVTIPQSIRHAAGIGPGTEVEFVLRDDGEIVLRRTAAAFEALDEAIDSLRGKANAGLSTELIMQLTRE
jgi:AbrB family looped-hinge helix DNA binding protein